ncbi:MAG: hypothetical protein H0W66_07275 [Chthoniobacterales bacterium]|nr:hypothetical protein [Chthoniobacterales bacterium]
MRYKNNIGPQGVGAATRVEIAHSAAPLHLLGEGMGMFSNLIVGQHFAWGAWNESRVVHAVVVMLLAAPKGPGRCRR